MEILPHPVRHDSGAPDIIDEAPVPEDPVSSAAFRTFGIRYLFPYQRLVVENVLERRSQIVILPTGAGKSLCFQLPAVLLDGPSLIVYPLLSLLADQKRRLEEKGIPIGLVRGGQSREERDSVWRGCADGTIRVVLTNPEAALSPPVYERLAHIGFRHLVIDEAHCISEWGETFRPSYLELHRLAGLREIPVVTAFTATASPEVIATIGERLFRGRPHHLVRGGADRPNIRYGVIPTSSKPHTVTLLAGSVERPALVFTRSRREAERTAAMLARRLRDPEIRFYHAGLSREEKTDIERFFFSSRTGILASTSAYGMGVDKPDIRTVIHTHVPPSVEAYLQESGRAGRDGGASTAVLVYSHEDRTHLLRIEREAERGRYERMLGYLEPGHCRREYLLSLLGQELEACFGCDACGTLSLPGEAFDSDEIRRIIVGFVKKYRKVFTGKETAAILSGDASLTLRDRGYHLLPAYGAVGSWCVEDLEEAIAELLYDGVLSEERSVLGKRGVRYLRIQKRAAVKAAPRDETASVPVNHRTSGRAA